MSFFPQLRCFLPRGFRGKPFLSRWHYLVNSSNAFRGFAQPALKEDEEVEELEIDQRRLPADYGPATFDPTEHRSPPTETVWRLVDEISALTLVEIQEFAQILMRKMDIKEPPVIGVMKPGAAGLPSVSMKGVAAAAKEEEKKAEKTVFEIKLESFDANLKLKLAKELRSLMPDLGLKEAKELVEKAPAVIKRGVSKEEGEKMIEKLNALGAKVVME